MYSFLFSPVCVASLTHLILFHFIIPIIFGKAYNHEASHYTVFQILLLLPSSYVQIFSTLPCSQSVSLMWEIKFYTHTKQQAKLYFHIFSSLYFYKADRKTEGSELNGSKYFPILFLHLISSLVKFWFLSIQPSNQPTNQPADRLTNSLHGVQSFLRS